MTSRRRPRVTFITAILTHYRVGFHERVRDLLADRGVDYVLVQGQPSPAEAAKGDTVSPGWTIAVTNRYPSLFGRSATWQPALSQALGSDLVIIGQENRLLLNYILQSLPGRFRPKLAFFGHGRNFQAADGASLKERWKRFWATRVDWWFGYTEETRRHVASLGFPADCITVFNNAVDTTTLRQQVASMTPERLSAARATLGLGGDHVAVYVGGLYAEKRLDFLIAAADRIRSRIPDFELVVVGGGVMLAEMQAMAQSRPWLKVTGPKFGEEKVELMMLGSVFLMPGLVGLAVLDAFVAGLPVITTDYPFHSPEVAYLEHGKSGLIVSPHEDVAAYAETVVGLLSDTPRRMAMAEHAVGVAASITIEAMAQNFADGVMKALAAPRR